MKRQTSISSFFTQKSDSSSKRFKLETTNANTTTDIPSSNDPPTCHQKKEISNDELQRLRDQFAVKLGSINQKRTEARQRVEQFDLTTTQPSKMTPLEKQVVELKTKYPGCLLLIEVGYKFRFFGDDAKIASRVLHIANFIDRNFYVASIPVHRLNYHVQK
ncbi:MAG: DNA mismatch repair protein MutS [Benjaminiella poitrasii]|nr:MAG: DNA mismatch repair protein MutS [Benjaminiella poitrasii]